MTLLRLATAAALCTAVAAQEPPTPGTAVGNVLPGPFAAYNVTGGRAGKFHDFVTDYGLDPVAAVFFREPVPGDDQPLAKLLQQLDTAVEQLGKRSRLHAFGIYLGLKDDFAKDDGRFTAIEQVGQLANKLSLKQVPLGLDQAESDRTRKYDLPADAAAVVLIYTNQTVTQRFVFGGDKALDEAGIKAVLDEVKKVTARK